MMRRQHTLAKYEPTMIVCRHDSHPETRLVLKVSTPPASTKRAEWRQVEKTTIDVKTRPRQSPHMNQRLQRRVATTIATDNGRRATLKHRMKCRRASRSRRATMSNESPPPRAALRAARRTQSESPPPPPRRQMSRVGLTVAVLSPRQSTTSRRIDKPTLGRDARIKSSVQQLVSNHLVRRVFICFAFPLSGLSSARPTFLH